MDEARRRCGRIGNLRHPMLKDHYRTLGLSPQASAEEVRRSYRRLAMEWHPDKKGENPRYIEIREAYETLSDPVRRESYLRCMRDEEAMGRRFHRSGRITIPSLVQKALQLEREVSAQDPFRIDGESLLNSIDELLDAHSVDLLMEDGDPPLRLQLTETLLRCGRPLTIRQSERLVGFLERMGGDDEACRRRRAEHLRQKRRESAWESWRIPVILIATVVLCLLIFLTGS